MQKERAEGTGEGRGAMERQGYGKGTEGKEKGKEKKEEERRARGRGRRQVWVHMLYCMNLCYYLLSESRYSKKMSGNDRIQNVITAGKTFVFFKTLEISCATEMKDNQLLYGLKPKIYLCFNIMYSNRFIITLRNESLICN